MTFNRQRILRYAEYAAVSASVVGAIAAIATRQIIYGVAPLSISAALNLANRRQWEQHLQQYLTQRTTQLDQQVDRLVEQNGQIEQRLHALTQSADHDFARVSELQSLRAEHSQLAQQLSADLQALQQRLVSQQEEAVSRISLEAMQADFRQLQIALVAIESGVLSFEDRLQTLERTSATDNQAWRDELQSLRGEHSQLAQQLSADLQALQQRLAAQQEAAVSRTSLEAMQADFRQLQIALGAIESSVLSFENRLQALEQAPTADDQAQAEMVQLRGDLEHLSHELTRLNTEIASLLIPPEPASADHAEPDTPETVIPPVDPLDRGWIPPQLASTQEFTLEINLGIDFGTGFTKVCFRDLASDLAEIVTFSDRDDVELQQALLSTRVAILADGTLLTGLTSAEWASSTHAVHKHLEFIKMRLAHLDLPEHSAWRLEQIPELDDPETVENVCAYYLSRVIARAQAWIQQHRANLFKNQVPRWSLNIGVPVEYCDSPALERFQRVLSLSWLLANMPSANDVLTLESLNQLGTNLRHWMQHNLDEELDCFTTPEISAAIWSFLSSREAAEKFYTFFDFGDGTLDGTAFRFWREPGGELKVDFYKGQVEPLGVTAFTKQAASELQTPPDTVLQALLEWQQAGESDRNLGNDLQSCQTRKQVQKLVARVIMQGKQKHQAHRGLVARSELGNQLELFISGGGGQNPFLQATVKETYEDFQHGKAGVPPYQVKQIPVPSDLTMNGLAANEFHRFAVAYGLCIPAWEGPEIRLPSEVEADEQPTFPGSNGIPRYEDTKDLM